METCKAGSRIEVTKHACESCIAKGKLVDVKGLACVDSCGSGEIVVVNESRCSLCP